MLETSSDTLLASSLLSNLHTLGRLDERFTVLRLSFGITVGYMFNCKRWFVAGTRRTEVGKGQPPASFKHAIRSFQFPLKQWCCAPLSREQGRYGPGDH